jgi:hypothetical protein
MEHDTSLPPGFEKPLKYFSQFISIVARCEAIVAYSTFVCGVSRGIKEPPLGTPSTICIKKKAQAKSNREAEISRFLNYNYTNSH